GDRRQVHDPIAPRGRSGDRHSRGRAAPTSSGPRMTHDPVARRGQRDWATIPNAITVLRLLLVSPITLLLANGAARVVTLVLLARSGASGWVDGYLARRLGQTSRTGAILGPLAGRVGVAAIAIAFVVSGHLPLWIAVLIAMVDMVLGVAYLCVRPAQMPGVSV